MIFFFPSLPNRGSYDNKHVNWAKQFSYFFVCYINPIYIKTRRLTKACLLRLKKLDQLNK